MMPWAGSVTGYSWPLGASTHAAWVRNGPCGITAPEDVVVTALRSTRTTEEAVKPAVRTAAGTTPTGSPARPRSTRPSAPPGHRLLAPGRPARAGSRTTPTTP
jgi:hypothetical protein